MTSAQAALMAALFALGACSWVPNAVNPVVWYRDLSGASKNDVLDKDQRNQQNLDAGAKEPYPNLADVPDVPDRAHSTVNRESLQKSLIADRENAKYSDEKLRAGAIASGALALPPGSPAADAGSRPPAAAPAVAAAAAPPTESPLVSPTVRSVPQGEMPGPAPPPPDMAPRTPVQASAVPPPAQTAALATGRRRDAPASSVAVAEIGFAGGSAALSDDERNRLSEVAAMQHKDGGALRVVGHGDPAPGAAAAAQPLDAFTLALNRAKAVAAELSAEGVAETAIAVETAPAGGAAGGPAPRVDVFLEH